MAAIRPLIAELELDGDGAEYCARFSVPGVDGVWAEIVRSGVNVAYPYSDDPVRRLMAMGIEIPAGITLDEWNPQVFAAFGMSLDIPSGKVARFVDHLLGKLLACGDDYPLDADVVKLKD